MIDPPNMSFPVDLALALAHKTDHQFQEMTKRVDKQSLLVRQLQTQVRNTKIGCGLGIMVAMGYTGYTAYTQKNSGDQTDTRYYNYN